jgi:putative Holliday junction resolvase
MVYLGLDLGSKTLGVSVSDRTGIIASSLEVLRYNDYEELLNKLDKIVEDRHVDVFVLGNPLNLNGSISVRSEMTFEFRNILEKRYNKEVIMQDERLSTVEANRMLISNDTRRKNRKKVVDKIAATIILQSYLDRRNNER